MKREGVFGLLWVLTVVLAASVAYWAGHLQLLSKETMEEMPDMQKEEMRDVQIVQPLTPPQRQLLETHSVQITKGMIVTVSEPGKPPQHFIGQAMPTVEAKFKLPKLPKYFPRPCRVRDSKGRLVWGICFSCRLDK